VDQQRSQNPQTLVVLRALALGDFLTGLPALRALRRAFPEHLCFLTCPGWLKSLAQATGVADKFIDSAKVPERNGEHWSPDDLRDRIKLEQAQLHGLVGPPNAPDIAVNLRGEREATQRVLLALRPRRLIAYRNNNVPETAHGPIWNPDEHEVTRWCRLLSESGIPADPEDLYLSLPEIEVPDFVRGSTLIHPGAGSPARFWPAERWAAVAKHELQRGRIVVITGGPDEVDLALEVAARSGIQRKYVLAGRTEILELAAIVSAAAVVVSAITGVAHLAWAVKTPTVTLFATVPPSRWGPPASPEHRVLWSGIPGEPYASEQDEGLLTLSVEAVTREIDALNG
jgi:ADP-heptose:LPS heptosyltransferase